MKIAVGARKTVPAQTIVAVSCISVVLTAIKNQVLTNL